MTIYAAIRYQDPDKAITWLCSAFGFVEQAVSREPDGGFQHGELRLGESVVLVSGPGEPGWMGSKPMDPLASSITLYAAVDDPAAHHDRARAAGATIVQEPMRMDYGSTEYSARDPEGNLWSFGTYRP
ncbi:VOC family protein [Actinophytocola gossypii]|uniref:VOC family protein n=1 Tax=Actinophytocola gossypii TaxID=2812003 RepID=A0ABT2JBX0_9PSEU|nr:VOC family protein [Actinophytocola gossypii]MCT2585358.1 VOC family protein [Actinophytocola gossypii]